MTPIREAAAAVVAVGSFPPPVHGAALVTERVVQRVMDRADVVLVDVEPGAGRLRWARKIWRYAEAAVNLVGLRPAGPCLYLAASGGEAILADAMVLGLARLLGYRLVVHHHSTRYLRARSRAMAGLCRLAGPRAVHVVLCEEMVEPMRRYPSVGEVLVVGNAALVEGESDPSAASGTLRLGHLSNLSREKGLAEVVDLARRLQDAGVEVTVELAGPPADADARALLAEAGEALGPALILLGPVDEAAKASFLDRIDVFVFPSRYRHEAQPLVVYEALAHGVPVVATDVGCLPDQVPDGGGAVLPASGAFAEAAAGVVPTLVTPDARRAARAGYEAHRQEAEAQLAALCSLVIRTA
jgi:glycosyltransferase involved in cell wall biosynthesis